MVLRFCEQVLPGPILGSELRRAVELAESNRAYWNDPAREAGQS
jgi:hypothetical protein